MIGLEVIGIRLLSPEDPPVLLLREEGGTRSLPIWIGNQEAAAIASALLWLVTDERAQPLALTGKIIELQKLVREHGLA